MACEALCVAVEVPGPAGAAGAAGAAGTNGSNAFSTLTDGFTMPALGADTPSLLASSSLWMGLGQLVYTTNAGWMRVISKADSTHVVLRNAETAGGEYAENVAAGTAVAAGQQVSPGGLQGPGGATSAGALLSANNLNDLTNYPTSRANLGVAIGANVQAWSANLDAVAAVVVTAAGTALLDDANAAAQRTTLGLGTLAVQDAAAVAITGGTAIGLTSLTSSTSSIGNASVGNIAITGTIGTVPSAIQSLLAATQITATSPKVRVVGNGGPVTSTVTPTIPAPLSDIQLILMGTSDVNTVTLQDNATLAGTRLRLGAATRVLGANDILVLGYDVTTNFWSEYSFVDVV